MPLLSITTNQAPSAAQAEGLLAEASALIARQLGKPERYVMVRLEHNPLMRFAGSADPLAYMELKSIGLNQDRTGALSEALCGLMEHALGIPPERVYIEFSDTPRKMWGWNSGTF